MPNGAESKGDRSTGLGTNRLLSSRREREKSFPKTYNIIGMVDVMSQQHHPLGCRV